MESLTSKNEEKEMEGIMNTRSMPLDPESPDEFVNLDEIRDGDLQLMIVMSGEMFRRTVAYGVIVEGWEKAKFGRNRRRWLAEFSDAERAKIGRYYGRFYRWYLVTGTPRRVAMKGTTIQLMARAANFFATVR